MRANLAGTTRQASYLLLRIVRVDSAAVKRWNEDLPSNVTGVRGGLVGPSASCLRPTRVEPQRQLNAVFPPLMIVDSDSRGTRGSTDALGTGRKLNGNERRRNDSQFARSSIIKSGQIQVNPELSALVVGKKLREWSTTALVSSGLDTQLDIPALDLGLHHPGEGDKELVLPFKARFLEVPINLMLFAIAVVRASLGSGIEAQIDERIPNSVSRRNQYFEGASETDQQTKSEANPGVFPGFLEILRPEDSTPVKEHLASQMSRHPAKFLNFQHPLDVCCPRR
ncbi:hypothetical protein B0H16DRAFT_1464337 [Mycena metata]|uniref:Uncharacterized protein n=1 Tax=Mycena metata TaxID=1033252 RepID=A0AAD7IHT1_9AGAR|nr:hypothetical protein B0H16DRAFT_1464337 [Mycena metata]